MDGVRASQRGPELPLSPEEGLSERVEVSEPDGTPNKAETAAPRKQLVEGARRFKGEDHILAQ
jgi:hypothetical protein